MILVIGATGPVGSELVRLLSQSGASVRAMTRDPSRAEKLLLPGVELVQADLGRPASLKPAFKGVERVFLASPGGPEVVAQQNEAVKQAKKAKVGLLVKLSAMGVSADSPSQIFRWHAQNEAKLAKSGLPHVILRGNFFMQNTLGHAATIREQGAFYAPLGEGRASQVDTRDIAAAAAAVLLGDGHAGSEYELTGPESITAARLAEVLSEELGREIRYIMVTAEAATASMIRAGAPEWLARDIPRLMAYWSDSLNDRVTDDLERLTGNPPGDFRQFVRDHRAAFE